MREKEARPAAARSSRWLIVGIVLTVLGLALTHVPGGAEGASLPRAGP